MYVMQVWCVTVTYFPCVCSIVTIRNEESELFTYTTRWDSDKIKGCQCDYPATGYDCSQQLCPNGDDPLTPGQVTARISGLAMRSAA